MPTAGDSAGKVLKRANPGTIQDKFLVGYQGWFTCANDGPPIGEGHHGWLHWLNEPLPANGRPNTDLWPDTSAYEPSELYPVEGLALRDGSPANVFSSRDPRTVRRHFHWMAQHGVDGAFLQRFVGQIDPEEAGNRDPRYGGTRRLRDEVGRRVREVAEAEGRVWAIMYDVSGVPAADVLRIVTQDIAHLVHGERVFDSPAYLRERGRPVVAVWGFGLSDSRVPPQTARAVFAALRAAAGDAYVFAGVPSHWRTPGAGDAHADPAWAALWLGGEGEGEGAVDAISPWSVGRFSTSAEVEAWAAERWAGDAELVAKHNEEIELGAARGRRVDYVPVVLPGGSGFNLSEGKWEFNGIKRNGGKFLWSQIFHGKRLKGVRSMYGAMWDEYDEGTAFLPVVEKKRLLPESDKWPFLALDEDGYDLPADWYMRIAGFAAEGLRSERRIHDSFPSKELQDYWSSRPRYEDSTSSASASASASSSSAAAGAASGGSEKVETDAEREARAQFDAWTEEQRRKEAENEDLPPPAYSLEDEGPEVVPEPVQQQPIVAQPVQQQQSVATQAQPVHQQPLQPQAAYGVPVTDAAVGALASDFARQHIGASPAPPLPARRESGPAQGRVAGGAALLAERPPLHPASQSGSHDSAGGASFVAERPPLHPSRPQNSGAAGSGSPEGQGQGQQQPGQSQAFQPGGAAGAYPALGGYQQAQAQPAGGPGPGSYPVHQQPQQTGSSASSYTGYQGAQHGSGSAGPQQHTPGNTSYPAQSGPPQQYPQQQQQHPQQYGQPQGYQSGGSVGAHPAQVGYQQAQHTGGSAGSGGAYPPPQQQQQQHTGGSSSSHGGYQQQRPTSSYVPQGGAHQQSIAPASGYPGQYTLTSAARPPPGQNGAGLRPSASLAARPTPSMYTPNAPHARPVSAAPAAAYAASVPLYGAGGSGGGGGYPPQQHASASHAGLAPRPESVRPTTPGYGGPSPHAPHAAQSPPHASYGPPAQPPAPHGLQSPPHTPHGPPSQPHSPYGTQFPPKPPAGSYPGSSSYNPPHAPPSVSLPSPNIPPASFPGPYSQSPGHAAQSFPAPQQGAFPAPHQAYPSPAPSSSPYPGPAFPQNDNGGNYFYQQPPQPQFPGANGNAGGYSPPQADVYSGHYAPQGQGAWAPSMPHRPGSMSPPQGYGQPQAGYGYGFPAPQPTPNSGPLGFATAPMDRIVGRRTRQQLEGTVESLTQSRELILDQASTKLLSKFGL
ncbi:hypothetical protein B0H15DRAFT_981954 [Mycena belliarum]|uniref:Uncharacterized protein n=1 Tax=Mycena belliarum TaxID=1033014 RepID=A0AAD6U4J5_9AGAR|nr:hypothetical protein B0H15DRAFT_981954 [Mycena belliae]